MRCSAPEPGPICAPPPRSVAERAVGLAAIAALSLAACILLIGPIERVGLMLEQPNEGWGAGHALNAVSAALYPGPGALFINNYPPLWFWLTGALARVFGDPIFPGRVVALAAFFGVAAGVFGVARRLGGSLTGAGVGALAFVATTAAFFRLYVGLDEPQMLAQALATWAAAVAVAAKSRRTIVAAALLVVVALLVKQVVIGLPLAVTLWLLLRRRSLALAWITAGAGAGLLALAALTAIYGAPFIRNITMPRYFSLERFGTSLALALRVLTPLIGFAIPAAILRRRFDDALAFAALAIGAAFVPLVLFGSALGVSINIGLDLVIAASIALAVGWDRASAALGAWGPGWRALVAAALVAVVTLDAPRDVFDPTAYAKARATSASLAALRDRLAGLKGPVVCETLSICVWAGKPSVADLWKLHHERTLAFLDPRPMLARLDAGGYAAVVLLHPMTGPRDDLYLPGLSAALAGAYRPPILYAGGAALYLPKGTP